LAGLISNELQSESDPDLIRPKLIDVEMAMFNRVLELGASPGGAGEIEEMKRAPRGPVNSQSRSFKVARNGVEGGTAVLRRLYFDVAWWPVMLSI
jgi:hypothetical protein